MPGVTIHEAVTLDDIVAMRAVFAAVWGEHGVPAPNVCRAMQHAGGYLALAVEAGDVVGGSLGFLGRREDGSPMLHSHITGTRPGFDNRGIGFALKQHQRSWCLERRIDVIEWTFDPLVRRNAFFNLAKLGALATEYHVDFYGDMDDAVNAGDESDRLVATWHLAASHAIDRDAPAGSVLALDVGESGQPIVCGGDADVLLHRVPAAVPEGRARAAWRRAVRDTLGAAITDGYVGTGMTPDGAYVVRRA